MTLADIFVNSTQGNLKDATVIEAIKLSDESFFKSLYNIVGMS